MKFQCDRCKTRYSIADERVRGKILKIRCKNCEAVITVREGMELPSGKQKAVAVRPRAAAAPAGKSPTIDSKPVLRGAFEKAMDSDSRPPIGFEPEDESTVISDPPQQLEEEWYTSLDGEQFGPFTLKQAQEWVLARPRTEEVFCWSEGFDDWLPLEKVGHFRRVRSEPGVPARRPASIAPPIPAAAAAAPSRPVPTAGIVPRSEETPKPLFAATLEAIEKEENPPVEALAREAAESGPNGRSVSTSGDDDDSSFEFEVGEASRVVKLPMLAAAMQSREGQAGPAGLPGMGPSSGDSNRIGAGTGGFATVGRVTGGAPIVVPLSEDALAAAAPDILAPTRRGHGLGFYLWIGGGVVAAVAVVVVMLMLAGGEESGGDRLVRSRASAEGLGESLDPRTIKIIETREVPAKGGSRRRGDARIATGGNGSDPGSTGTSLFGKTDDLDLTGTNDDDRPLDGDDLMKVYRDNRLAVKLCYESALKKDPLLDVKKIYVSLTVSPTGVVTNVLLSSHQDSQLGNCLVSRMRKWRFRKSPEVFSGRFPLVFRN